MLHLKRTNLQLPLMKQLTIFVRGRNQRHKYPLLISLLHKIPRGILTDLTDIMSISKGITIIHDNGYLLKLIGIGEITIHRSKFFPSISAIYLFTTATLEIIISRIFTTIIDHFQELPINLHFNHNLHILPGM